MVSEEANQKGLIKMNCYHHYTTEERESLYFYLTQGKKVTEIVELIGKHKSSIYRELKRNALPDKEIYSPSSAEKAYKERRKRSVREKILCKNRELRNYVHQKLVYEYWSPEQIAQRLRKETGKIIGVSTIYRALDNGALRPTMSYYLRIKSKKIGKAKKKDRRNFANSITNRPVQANNRTEIGHFESDSVLLSKEKRCVFTHVDRKSRYLIANLSNRLTPESMNEKTAKAFSRFPPDKIKTITCDRGQEFSLSNGLKKLINIEVYFAHAHSPWERGTNENTNGLLRQFIPKRSDQSKLSDYDVQCFVRLLNLRPRKVLGWLTPFEVFFDKSLHLT